MDLIVTLTIARTYPAILRMDNDRLVKDAVRLLYYDSPQGRGRTDGLTDNGLLERALQENDTQDVWRQ